MPWIHVGAPNEQGIYAPFSMLSNLILVIQLHARRTTPHAQPGCPCRPRLYRPASPRRQLELVLVLDEDNAGHALALGSGVEKHAFAIRGLDIGLGVLDPLVDLAGGVWAVQVEQGAGRT